MVQSWILPVQCTLKGKLTSSNNTVSCPHSWLSLSCSIRSEISIQLQHYWKLLPHSKLTAVSQSKALPLTFVGQCHRNSVGWLGALLQHAAGPRDDGQGDSAPELLQKAHQRCVGHPPCTRPVHLEQDVPTPTQNEMAIKNLFYRYKLNLKKDKIVPPFCLYGWC